MTSGPASMFLRPSLCRSVPLRLVSMRVLRQGPLLAPAAFRSPLPATRTPWRHYAKKGGRGFVHHLARVLFVPAKKKAGGGGAGASLSEEEREVIDLARMEAAMQASITALKWEYTNTLITRITPGILVCI